MYTLLNKGRSMYVHIEQVSIDSRERATICVISPRHMRLPASGTIHTHNKFIDHWFTVCTRGHVTAVPRSIRRQMIWTRPRATVRVNSLRDMSIIEHPVECIMDTAVDCTQMSTVELDMIQTRDYADEPWRIVHAENIIALVIGEPSEAPMDLIVSGPSGSMCLKLVEQLGKLDLLEPDLVIGTVDCMYKNKNKKLFYNPIRHGAKLILTGIIATAIKLCSVVFTRS